MKFSRHFCEYLLNALQGCRCWEYRVTERNKTSKSTQSGWRGDKQALILRRPAVLKEQLAGFSSAEVSLREE